MSQPSASRGLPSREQAALSSGGLFTGMFQFGDVRSAPQANQWSSFAIDFPYRILGWKMYSLAGGAPTNCSAVIKVYHAIWPPISLTEISGSEDPTLTTEADNEDYALTTWGVPGRTFLDVYANEPLYAELFSFSGSATALFLALRLQRL